MENRTDGIGEDGRNRVGRRRRERRRTASDGERQNRRVQVENRTEYTVRAHQ
jgi:hypothetical protein